ncbi:chromosome partitioning protein [Methanococcus maripaludis]|uniref:Chromosome partitioning protein n=1 Tax=Methanococcus maripaludis TaxID=39152 RepID=A0A7J9NX26_METMI|nr:ParA family protein [Methanococcus maripaludis]MBA2851857.1 chromosome partitioning protein [Methanococcus maripaludis]
MEVITFSNHKGGVGKTTICYNVAAMLAERGCDVLCIDMDPQRNLSLRFNIDTDKCNCIEDIIDIDKITINDINDCVLNVTDHLDIIPSSELLAVADYKIKAKAFGFLQFRDMVNLLRPYYDFILIDTPPILNELTNSSIVASDSVVIIVEPSESALQGINSIIDLVDRINTKINIPVKVKGVVFNKYDDRSNNPKMVVKSLKEKYSDIELLGTIRTSAELGRCDMFKLPITKLAPKAKVIKDFKFIEKWCDKDE